MSDYQQHLVIRTDKPYEVKYTDRGGQQKVVRGKLKSPDDRGYVVLVKSDGKQIVIPKDLVESMEEQSEEQG